MSKKTIFISILLVAALIFVGYYFFQSRLSTTNISTVYSTIPSGGYPGLQMSSFPWPAEITHLKERLDAIHLPALKEEGVALHTHQHIDIFINGTHVDIPGGIGINENDGFISPIHVHDEPDIIHVESPTIQTFTLGQFFDIWGVRFSDACVGGYCSDLESKLQVFVNGKEISNHFRDIELTAHEEIVVVYGKEKDVPSPVPASYDFPKDL